MDRETLDVYNRKAASIAARHRGNTPNRVHEEVALHLHPGAPTADIGCGSGRDTDWLNGKGYPTIGYDGSEGMLAEARRVYPDHDFRLAFLPDLAEIPDESYLNVVCNAVLMHLPRSATPIAVRNLARILRPGGRLILSFRGSQEEEEREADGRLFTHIQLDEMRGWVEAAGLHIVTAERLPDPVRTGGEWSLVVAERPA